jgi:hypothetical protein
MDLFLNNLDLSKQSFFFFFGVWNFEFFLKDRNIPCFKKKIQVGMYCKIEKKNIVSNLLRFITTIHTIWTHLKQIECLSWTPACIFIHQIVHLSFSILLFYLFWFQSIEFPSKMVQV